MEAIAAFALAGTVATFVDFSCKLISEATGLYRTTSGALSANQQLELAISDMRRVLAEIHSPNVLSTEVFDPSDLSSDADLRNCFVDMCESAKAIADEILGRLERLKVDEDVKGTRRVWASLSQAVKSAWSSTELATLAAKLKSLKDLLEFRVICQLRTHLDLLTRRITEGLERLDVQTEYIISALAQSSRTGTEKEMTEQTTTLTKLLARLETSNSQEHRKTREMIAAIGGTQKIIVSSDVLEIPHTTESRIRREVSNGILKLLNFEARTHRFEELTEAYKKTFEWVFEESLDEQRWSNFSQWLSHGERVYWIQGKAGAGKSTLMGFIYEDPRTRRFLNSWAQDSLPLYIGSFFFWLSGTREQKSQQGLLRSLLFEILNQEPNLVPVVFPHLWAEGYNRCVSGSPGFSGHAWSLRVLKDAFWLLVNQNIVPIKLCLFIDGLDEFDGDPEEICKLFGSITSCNVKVCLSSRPWVVFKECFEGLPSLRLQDLTRPDIVTYVEEVLSGNFLFRRHTLMHPSQTNDFIQEIVEKADGVFLWVAIVVKSLLNGIRNRDTITEMQTRLRRLPKELEPLYNHLLNLIEPEYLLWASKAFQLLVNTQQHRFFEFLSQSSSPKAGNTLTLLDLTFAMDQRASITDIRIYAKKSGASRLLISKCEDTRIQLTARCAGLLETWDLGDSIASSQVQFLHRTARDYLLLPSVWQRFVSITPASTFNPNISLLRAYAFQISIAPIYGETWDVSTKAIEALSFAFAAEGTQLESPPELLESLRRAMSLPKRHPLWDDLPSDESMMPIAAMFGLSSYLRSKPIEARKKLIGNGASLLHYAIPRQGKHWNQSVRPTLHTVQLLLETCDVNLVYESATPWQQAFTWTCVQRTEVAQSVKLLIVMLRAGANPYLNVPGNTHSVRSLNEFLSAVASRAMGSKGADEELLTNIAELDEEFNKAYNRFDYSSVITERQQSKTRSLKAWLKKWN